MRTKPKMLLAISEEVSITKIASLQSEKDTFSGDFEVMSDTVMDAKLARLHTMIIKMIFFEFFSIKKTR
jgi:hypothetical protein